MKKTKLTWKESRKIKRKMHDGSERRKTKWMKRKKDETQKGRKQERRNTRQGIVGDNDQRMFLR
jgi:hypothetical protein